MFEWKKLLFLWTTRRAAPVAVAILFMYNKVMCTLLSLMMQPPAGTRIIIFKNKLSPAYIGFYTNHFQDCLINFTQDEI